jgi:hypothetical protein
VKIIFYNRNLVFFKDQIKLLRYFNFIKPEITNEYIDLFKEANFLYNQTACFIDRTNGIKPFIEGIKPREIPKEIGNFDINKSFKQICDERSIELFKTKKRVNLMWSGGIDSTVPLFSLIKNSPDLSQLRIILTPDSIAESGNIFDKHIKDKIDFILAPKCSKNQFYNRPEFKNFILGKEIVTSGCNGDNINSIQRITLPYEEKLWNLQYEEALSQFTSQKVIDFLNKWVKFFPKKIKIYKDFLKFYGFNFHWHKETYYNLVGTDPKYYSSYTPFYNTDDFQKWAIWNKESDVLPNITKKPQRDLIYELSQDKLYSYNKIKSMSGPGLHEPNNWFFLTDDGHTIRHKDLTNIIYDDIKKEHYQKNI